MKTMIWLLLIQISLISFAAGENGGYAGAYLRMGLGARSVSLGNAGVADRSSGYAFYYNPALSALLEDKVVSLSYRFLSLDRRFNFISYGMKVPPGAGLSVGWISTGVDNITGYNRIGEQTGEIGHSANGAFFNVSRIFMERLAVGVSIKYLWESLDLKSEKYSSSGFGWDIGMWFRFTENLHGALVARDLSSQLKANTDNLFEFGGTTVFEFPTLYLAGLHYQTPMPWLHVLYDFEMSNRDDQRHHVGIEADYEDRLALRIGMNDGNFTAGAGMGFTLYKYKSKLDYAFVPSVIDEGSSHIFSWQIRIP